MLKRPFALLSAGLSPRRAALARRRQRSGSLASHGARGAAGTPEDAAQLRAARPDGGREARAFHAALWEMPRA